MKNKKVLITLSCVMVLLLNITLSAFAIDTGINANSQEKDIVFLTEGQGSVIQGDGSQDNPYTNINTAIKHVTSGGIIKIIGTVSYSNYEEHQNLLPRPLVINKNVIFEGVDDSSLFMTRAPIQLAEDVIFRNLKMEFWASNELMPGIPDSGLPGEPVDIGTDFRSGRSIYLAGHSLTLDNIDTRVDTVSFQRDYRPYINGGTFLDEGSTGPKAVLNIINPNEGTQIAGIYAGDYWVERNYPVELNIRGEIVDRTIHTGGITTDFAGDVVVNIYNKAKVAKIDKTNHSGNVDVNIKENTTIYDAQLSGVRNLTLENKANVSHGSSSDFNVNNITINSEALLDLTNVAGNAVVNGDFKGVSNVDNLSTGTIFLHKDQLLDINGDVIGSTKLNSYNDINKISLKENHLYIKAKENATGNFTIDPDYSQSDYILQKNSNDSQHTTWTTIRNKKIFKSFSWKDSNGSIINPENTTEVIYPIQYVDENDEVYTPFGEDWDDFSATLTKPDGTILDINGVDWDSDLGIYLNEDGVIVDIYNPNYSGEITLTVKHIDGKSITRKIQIAKGSNTIAPVIHGANNVTIPVGKVDKFNENLLSGITVTDDKDKIDTSSVSVIGKVEKPSAGSNLTSKITYTVKDNDGNVSKIIRAITVTNQLPTIQGLTDLTIKRGQTIDIKSGVTAKDNEDGTLTSKIVFPTVDLSNLTIGKHKITYKVKDSDNNVITKTRIVNVKANTITKTDLIGTDRYETAVKISKTGWNSANTVILVNGLNQHLVDGLTATPLASALNAPILLTQNKNIPKSTINELKRLKPNKVIVIGGTGVVDNSVITQVKNIDNKISVKRLGGKNRYETCLNIAKELDSIVPITKVYIGAGNGEPDALSISPVAGREKAPIILTAKNNLDTNTYNYLKSKKLSDAYFIGGSGIISDNVINQVNGIVSKNVLSNRVAGVNRRETNANVIKKFYPQTLLDGVIVAKDIDLVDSLAVGPLAAKLGFPVVLAQSALSNGQEQVLKSKVSNKLYQAGGGVSKSVLESLKKLLTT